MKKEYMEFIFNSNLSNLSYILSGKRTFFYRYCDTGFKNKWTGLWSMPNKFVEYFAIKINGEWLSPKTITSFSSDEFHSEHKFKLQELNVREFLFVPERRKSLVCKLMLENLQTENRNVEIDVEAAINIREREENWHDRKYSKIAGDGIVIVSSIKGCIAFGSVPKGNIVSDEEYKDHYPSGEFERCFIPGIYRINVSLPAKGKAEVSIIFSCGENELEASSDFGEQASIIPALFIEKQNSYLPILENSKFKSGNESLDNLFHLNVIALEKLAFSSKFGFGYFAGLPWFTQFWGRDLGWMIPAIVDYGNFEGAKMVLKTLAKSQSEDGRIPNVIYMNGDIDYNSVDATTLWIIALNHYIVNSGDSIFLEEIQSNLTSAIKWYWDKNRDKDGFIQHGKGSGFGNDTWMDTLDRGTKAVEAEAFWIEALKSAANLYNLLGNQKIASNLQSEAIELKSKFEKMFWNNEENFYYDRITNNGIDKRKTVNAVFPLLFNLSQNPKKVLEKFEGYGFHTPFGITTLSKKESDFNPAGYHTGSIWGFSTLAVGCAEFANNRIEKGLEILNLMSKRLFEKCVGAIGEVWNSDTNEQIGCCLQGWSSALAIICIDEYLLGLKINAFENSIILSPSLTEGMRIERRKRIGDDVVDLKIERRNNQVKVDCSSSKGKTYKIILAPKQ
jgi:glycogen debranching enzyme